MAAWPGHTPTVLCSRGVRDGLLEGEAQPALKQQHLFDIPRRKTPLLLRIKSLKYSKEKRDVHFPHHMQTIF